MRLDHLLSRENRIRRFAGGSEPSRSIDQIIAMVRSPRGIGRPRKRDELAALEPTDLPSTTRVPVTLQPSRHRSRPAVGAAVRLSADPLALRRRARYGYHAAPRGGV